jgi:hypothetical protein
MKYWRLRSSLAMAFTCKNKQPNIRMSNDFIKWKWKMVKGLMKTMHLYVVPLSFFLLSFKCERRINDVRSKCDFTQQKCFSKKSQNLLEL